MSRTIDLEGYRRSTQKLADKLKASRRSLGANLLGDKSLILPNEAIVNCQICNQEHTIERPEVDTIWRCRNTLCRARNHAAPQPENITA